MVVNTVSRSGTNNMFGRVFDYYQGNKLQATDYFLKQAGEENPDSRPTCSAATSVARFSGQALLLRQLRVHAPEAGS